VAVVPIDFRAVRSSAESATHNVAGLLRRADDGSAAVPGLEWTVGEVGAHLVALARGYIDLARGGDSATFRDASANINAQKLAEYSVREPSVLADALVDSSARFLSAITADDSSMTMVGIPTDRSTAAAVFLAELVVHGADIAKAVRAPWKIERTDALMAFYAGLNFLHVWVDADAARDLRATYEVRPRGGEPVTMAIADATLEIKRGRASRPDCIISGDPVSLLLVGYGRRSHWTAALLGQSIAYGRKPWLALRFNKIVRLP
jgi:uncharacterized protein (TIGR03083 family)